MKLVGATLIAMVFIASVLFISATRLQVHLDIRHDNSIVRLHTTDGSFFCSGTVINDTEIVTAAHCVSMETPFGVMVDADRQIEVRGQDGLPTGIAAHIRNINPRMDTAMLIGDFHLFDKRAIEDNPAEIDRILLDPESEIVSCGYPLGGPLVCNKLSRVRHYAFMYAAQGWLYPGMSGGPVIDLHTGKVLAVNRAVGAGPKEDEIVINPLVDFIYNMLHA